MWNPTKKQIVVARDVDFVEENASLAKKSLPVQQMLRVPVEEEDVSSEPEVPEEDPSDGEFESFVEELAT